MSRGNYGPLSPRPPLSRFRDVGSAHVPRGQPAVNPSGGGGRLEWLITPLFTLALMALFSAIIAGGVGVVMLLSSDPSGRDVLVVAGALAAGGLALWGAGCWIGGFGLQWGLLGTLLGMVTGIIAGIRLMWIGAAGVVLGLAGLVFDGPGSESLVVLAIGVAAVAVGYGLQRLALRAGERLTEL